MNEENEKDYKKNNCRFCEKKIYLIKLEIIVI